MVYVNSESAYMNLRAPFVAMKLSLDFWGCVDKEGVKDIYERFIKSSKDMIPEHLHTTK